jgi:hypothetical protein
MKEIKVFPASSGGRLNVAQTLLETLYINYQLAEESCELDRRAFRIFVQGAETVWAATARKRVLRNEINFISWLRSLLRESQQSGIWIPRIFIKRLRELERGELVLYVRGTQTQVPSDEGLPREFSECHRLCGWRWKVVPDIKQGSYVNPFDRSADSSERYSKFVHDVVEVWRNRPHGTRTGVLRKWVVSELAKKRWNIP